MTRHASRDDSSRFVTTVTLIRGNHARRVIRSTLMASAQSVALEGDAYDLIRPLSRSRDANLGGSQRHRDQATASGKDSGDAYAFLK
jgi:hypothetical protein